MLRTHYSNNITDKLEDKSVTVAGWVKRIRDIGKLIFIIIQDGHGEIQITAKHGEPSFKELKEVGNEWVLSVQGVVKKNKQAPGGYELIPTNVTIVNKASTPLPLDIHGKVESELETRLNHRYIDLRTPEVRSIFRIKDVIQTNFMKYLDEQGFLTINPPIIVAAATESGAALFPISYFDKEAFLAQSPQLYKQMVMAGGLDKVCMITPAFRAEEHDTTRHLNEVTQMDIEVAFVESEDEVIKYLEDVINYICKAVIDECSEELQILKHEINTTKIKRIEYDDVLKILKKDGIKIEWGSDITPEAERAISKNGPVIVTKWPLDIRAFYSMPNGKYCRAFDLIMGGIEICSGAQRIHDVGQLTKEMKRRKMNPANFEFYLDAFRYGMPPHAGWSIGLERLTMALTGRKNIREVTLYPRTRTRLTP